MMQDKLQEIEKDIAQHNVLLYMKGEKTQPMCRFSLDVVKALNSVGAEFETRNVLEDDELREAIKVFSDWPTLPQLYVNGEFLGGRDIIMEMQESGELVSLFSKE